MASGMFVIFKFALSQSSLVRVSFFFRSARRATLPSNTASASGPACRAEGTSYSKFIAGLKKAGIELDRRALAELALNEPTSFAEVCKTAPTAASAILENQGLKIRARAPRVIIQKIGYTSLLP